MTWKVRFTASAEKEFEKLIRPLQQRVVSFLEKLVEIDPRSQGTALKGSSPLIRLWRYRVGKHRIICQIKDTELNIIVVCIAKRDSVYKEI